MRGAAVMLLLSVAWSAAEEAETTKPPPAFLPLRFNEDYSYLADPTVHIDAFDPLKYLRLRADDPAWYLSFGGELRRRGELISKPNFGLGGRRGGYLLQRFTHQADLHLSHRLRVYV